MTRFEPPELSMEGGGLAVAAAMDVTDIQRLVRQNLFFALCVLGLATLISVAFGTRLARIMSGALKRVNDALKKLEVQEYAHIQGGEDGRRARGPRQRLQPHGRRPQGARQAAHHLRQVHDRERDGPPHERQGRSSAARRSRVTILFTDIRSFTTISEKMDAQALVGLLNEYFTEMVGIVMSEDGVVDKYIGDAIMAVFGAPVPKPDDAIRAVRAAVRMRTALVHLNERLAARGLPPLRTGIGIHTGEVVAGNIGSETRMEYTVIGDAVNLASRLESSTKELGVNVLISEDTCELVKDHIDARPVKEITVKGRAQPVMTYEVLGIVGEAPIVATSEPPAEHQAEALVT